MKDLNWALDVTRRKNGSPRRSTGGKDYAYGSLAAVDHDPDMKNIQRKQVFTSAAASGILINNLGSIMESSKEAFIVPDTVGDNIFQWNVKLSEFSDTALDQELRHLFGQILIMITLSSSWTFPWICIP